MSIRILHCSTSVENYYICLNQKVAGFSNRGPQPNDLIYLVVKIGKKGLCGARFLLDELTDNKPWPDAEKYVHALTIKSIEYCEPFDISILSTVGGKFWGPKYLQGSKPISEPKAIELLQQQFLTNRTDSLFLFENSIEDVNIKEIEDDLSIEDDKELKRVLKEVPDIQINIMGTFQTVHFSNETDKIKGLEVLVNENFYSLFPHFPENRTVLIPENRLFKTKGLKKDGNTIQGISTIPDGILIVFSKKPENPFQINLIEYECYGEKKTRETEKSNYLNSIIIPQLMRFASAFSIITDDKTREKTIEQWVDKIIDFINADDQLSNKVIGWVKELKPDIKERSIEREIEKLLFDAFKNNIRVLLIIDELSSEQKSTIKNVVSSFKLENGESVQFIGYVVRLVQRINIINNESEYALTVQ